MWRIIDLGASGGLLLAGAGILFSGIGYDLPWFLITGLILLIMGIAGLGIYAGYSFYIRTNAEKKLNKYLKTNQIKLSLINQYCELRFIDGVVYCKERTNGKKQGRYFEIKGNSDHAATIWGLLNAEFSSEMKYNDVKRFYRAVSKVSRRAEYRLYFDENDMIINRPDIIWERVDSYYYESRKKKYPEFLMNEAQNEYCRITLKRDGDYFYLLCEEIWGRRSFVIECENPETKLYEFRNMKDKMRDYTSLLKYYKYLPGCKVITDYRQTAVKQPEINLEPPDFQPPEPEISKELPPNNSEREVDL